MLAMFVSSWRAPHAGVEVVESFKLGSGELDPVGGGVLLDPGDTAGADIDSGVSASMDGPSPPEVGSVPLPRISSSTGAMVGQDEWLDSTA